MIHNSGICIDVVFRGINAKQNNKIAIKSRVKTATGKDKAGSNKIHVRINLLIDERMAD